ncbi:MAG: hypothetical protein L0Z50_39250, partial [Verrucomicrobiales bacterium]|nr:hypothetical protein [Verrucomicrobiales bacterium]
NSQDATVDHLASVLKAGSVQSLRFDTDTCLCKSRVSFVGGKPCLIYEDTAFFPSAFTAVWYRRPERLKHADIADTPEGKFVLDEWSEAFEGFFAHIPKSRWMNHPSANAAASHKLEQITAAAGLGFLLPETLLTQDAVELRAFYARHQGKIIAKPLARGYVERAEGETDTLIYTNPVSAEDLTALDDLSACPTLFQELIDKRTDVRITVVDEDIHAVEMLAEDESGTQRCDIRRNNMQDVRYQTISLPVEVASRVRALMRHYQLRFAAIDMVVSKAGDWIFLEVNPNGQWAWLDLVGATNIADSFVRSFRGGS